MDNPNCVIVSIDEYKKAKRNEALLSLIYDICKNEEYDTIKLKQITRLMAIYDPDNPIEVHHD